MLGELFSSLSGRRSFSAVLAMVKALVEKDRKKKKLCPVIGVSQW